MNKIFTTLLLSFVIYYAAGQTYNMGSIGIVSTCGGNFYDNGGELGDYASNMNSTMTFCSNSSGFISVDFSSMSLSAGDNLYVYYGDVVDGTPNLTNPPVGLITSTCRCITFVFVSDAITVSSGWAGTIGCTSPSIVANDYIMNSTTPPLNGDCLLGQTNVGSTSDVSSGCFSSGNTVWYGFSLSGGNNTIEVSLKDATFPNVEYALLYNYNCSDGSATVAGTQCTTTGSTAQWTNLTQSYYWLGISSTTTGTFDLCINQSYTDVCGDYYCGQSESCLTCPYDCGICPETTGGPYFHPTKGMQSTCLGQCMVATNTGTYFDDGGPATTYSRDINQVYRTFCPKDSLMALRATISHMGIEYPATGCKDQLLVKNGPTLGSTTIWSGCGNTALPVIRTTSGAYGGGVFTSTHTSGCLTFAFSSDAANTGYWEGWEIAFTTVPAIGVNTYNNDCVRSIPLCDDYTVSSQMYGPGMVSEACASCALAENYSEWYKVKVASGGIMEFEIKPLGNSDMDFAVYKADSCGAIEEPIRCSHATYASPGKTGLTKSAGDISETISGDQWVAELPIQTNETYYIMVNEVNKNNPNSYTLDFILSAGASFDCSIVLPVTFHDFSANIVNKKVELIWETATEANNDYFTVERSVDGIHFEPLVHIDGAGNSNELLRYSFVDEAPVQGLAYYRIKQTDFDGIFDYSLVLPVDILDVKDPWLNMYPSPAAEAIHISTDESSMNKPLIVYNAIGAEVWHGTVTGSEMDLSVADFDEGLYYLSIENKARQSFLVVH